MFESTVGYAILEWEPQEFCNNCAQKLIDWQEYKALCQKTQESLEMPMIPVKTEPEEVLPEVKQEVMDDNVKPEMSVFLEPSRLTSNNDENETLVPSPMVDETHEIILIDEPTELSVKRKIQKEIEITFEVYIRYYKYEQLSEKSFIGVMPISTKVERNLFMFRSQLWMAIKQHLIREIIFTEERKPVWAEFVRPTASTLSHFVEFSYNYSSYTFDVLTNANLKLWNGKQVILYVYPYSTSIKTKDEWKEVTEKLFKFKKRPEKKLKTHHETEKSDSKELEPEVSEVSTEHETKGNDASLATNSTNSLGTDPKSDKVRIVLTKVRSRRRTPPIPNPNEPVTLMFETYILNYIAQPLTFAKYLGSISIMAETKNDLKKQLWQLIHSFVVRKSLFKPGEYPFREKFPCFNDVDKFVEFRLTKSPHKTYLDQISTRQLHNLNGKKTAQLYIYPYTTAITSESEWERMTKKLIAIDEIDNRITKAMMGESNECAEDVIKMEEDEDDD